MAGRIPVSKLKDLSVPLESPGKEAMTLLYRKGWEPVWIYLLLNLGYLSCEKQATPPLPLLTLWSLSSSPISLGPRDVEAALDRMIDRCRSGNGGTKVNAEELASILGLNKKTAVHICSLYSRVLLLLEPTKLFVSHRCSRCFDFWGLSVYSVAYEFAAGSRSGEMPPK